MRHVAAALLAAALLAACQGATTWPPAPAEARLGEDACAHCRMIVSDGRFAAQAWDRDGTVEWFDDVGCVLERRGGPGSDPAAVFVHAFDDASWVRGDTGFVVRSPDIASPMGHGFAAFATRARADAAAAKHRDASVSPLSALLLGGAGSRPILQLERKR
jgi:copper chaperone NosL